jgi:hypothetical protein
VSDAGIPVVFHVLLGVGVAVVGALVVVLRRLGRAVALEHADQVLRAEIDRCEPEQPAPPEAS